MSKTPPSDSSRKKLQIPQQGKILLSALAGAVIGSAACLHTYYSSLGGAEQYRRIAQIEATVEHNRLVGEEVLAILKRIEVEVADSAVQGDKALSKKPTQREISDAIEGLFEGLDEGTQPDGGDSKTQPASQHENASLGASADVDEDVMESEIASSEAKDN